jgi:DNA-binding protein HU-beta
MEANFFMTKTDLVDAVAKKTKLTKKDAGKAVDAIIGSISGSLAKGNKVQLVGFGSFEVRKREARKGRNPQTGAEIKIAARKVPVFKAGKVLKEAVSKK